MAPALVSGPWAILLDVGLPVGRDLIDMADLDNYALPLASHLSTEHLVSVWCSKRHAQTSRVVVVPAQEVPAPEGTFTVRTTASSQTKAYQEQVRGFGMRAGQNSNRLRFFRCGLFFKNFFSCR